MPETILSVSSKLTLSDKIGMIKMRFGIKRNRYRVMPGLYKVGAPTPNSPVFVSANYKMSFDILRNELAGIDAWILVINTRGVNVWCAAGKKTFSTCEIVRMIHRAELEKHVDHRELILPQLSAPGVAAHEVLKSSGFRVIFGPVRAKDIKQFMDNGKKANESMREVTFTAWERLVLTPLEFTSRTLISLYVIAAIFILSGLGHNFFAFGNAWPKAFFGTAVYFIALIGGGFIAPLLLPWIPGRSFSIKGAFIGLVLSAAFCVLFQGQLGHYAMAALILFSTAVSSYVALNFTGATPFTSPTGVEKEMRRAIPLQVAATISSIVLWIVSAFTGGAL